MSECGNFDKWNTENCWNSWRAQKTIWTTVCDWHLWQGRRWDSVWEGECVCLMKLNFNSYCPFAPQDLLQQFKANCFMSFNSYRRFTVDLRHQKNDRYTLSDIIEKLDQFTSSRNLKYTLNAFTLEEIFESLISDSVVISTENYDNKGFISDWNGVSIT